MILEDGGWIYEIDTLDNENQRFDPFRVCETNKIWQQRVPFGRKNPYIISE